MPGEPRPTRGRAAVAPRNEGEFGARPAPEGVRFRVCAPAGADLRLHVLTGRAAGIYEPVARIGEGVVECVVRGAGAGDRYGYTIDGSDLRPDPASRRQPDGVHGASEIVDPDAYGWRCDRWSARDAARLVIYELHVGTFTRAGTFAAARERLPDLHALGITAVELMPIADFPGCRNWGYDGVCLYAPARCYGHPDDLRAFVDAAHELDIAVMLDVVYNHLGPEGAYLPQFWPQYMTKRHATPWGDAVNLDGPGSGLVRRFIIDNAIHWLREYRIDGLRLDATHALVDDSPVHLAAELAAHARAAVHWPVIIHAEDHRNLASLVAPQPQGGWGLDGVWADDFHHVVRRKLAGDAHGYYADFAGTMEELARTIEQGWLFTGQVAPRTGRPRGSDVSDVPMHRFVVCLQNHDQIGNRARGDRLHHAVDLAAWRAASALLLTLPMTPLLFMGQEWAASTPFQYFTDVEPALGRLVTEGRRREFSAFPEFASPEGRERIPDPQAPETFDASRLRWDERSEPPHATTLALYRELLRLRQAHRALGAAAVPSGDARPAGEGGLVMYRSDGPERFAVLVQLSGSGTITARNGAREAPAVVLSTEDARFAPDPVEPDVTVGPGEVTARFMRPGAIIARLA